MTEKVKVLVVEDETIIAQSIISMLEKMDYECVGTAIRATKALELARKTKPDIALLDIQLKGEETGIWLAKELKQELDIPFIFLTSYGDKNTVESAVSTYPYGYLLKPVNQTSIYAAIETALTKFSEEKNQSPSSPAPPKKVESSSSSHLIKNALFIKDEYQYVKIELQKIDYIKSNGNYVEIHSDGRKNVIKETLKKLEARLPQDLFFQVHRSYIVNIEKVESIGGNSIKVNGNEVPIVKPKKDELLDHLNKID